MADNCLFCKIAAGEIPAQIVYQDELVVAFNDIDPQAPVHVLIIPRKHIAGMNDVVAEDSCILMRIHQVAIDLARQLNVAESGYRLVNNCNDDGGQAVPHLHYHFLAGRKMTWPPG
ncbi:MAG: histidine triad nucleotide-binding protein [Desulfuromonas sp.]|nr:histidine triad nucleotide-binding protein [Desulfuromonas sp.]